jgi:hypothetical protein
MLLYQSFGKWGGVLVAQITKREHAAGVGSWPVNYPEFHDIGLDENKSISGRCDTE